MCRVSGIALLAIVSIVCLMPLSACRADAEAKTQFDLPAEPLDKALRDFAVQAKCNISYEPSLVAGLGAPAIKGQYTASYVLSMLLTGTKLQVVNVNEDTYQVMQKRPGTSLGVPADDADHTDDSKMVHLAYGRSDAPAAGAANSDAANTSAVTANAKDQDNLQEITVTGSHIRGVPSASPVIEIGREEIDRSGYTSISDLMLSVPQNFGGGYNPGTSVGNSQVNNRFGDNPTGASVPNLRGLGPGSTLTLIDGHRMASGLTGGGADISSIPIDAIERIEVVTDSASSIYGSDAVAGVVNIILKRNYDGAKTSLSYGLATQGGGTEKRASQTFGTTWSGGSLMVAYEHREQALVDAGDRAFSSASLEPYSLLPQTRSNALTLSATQNISANASAFIDGLLVARDANSFVSNLGIGVPFDNPSTLRKYAFASGFDFALWSDWKLAVFANAAEDVTENNTGYLGVAPPYPASDERELGRLRSVEANANGIIANLPTGPVRLAVGAGYRQESFSDAFGVTGGPYTDRPNGDRDIRYTFGELSLPLVPHSQRPGLNYLDLVISARNERYSDFGDKTVPKIGVVYSPTASLKLRSTWGKAFKAPNLNDINDDQQLIILDLTDPLSRSGTSTVLVRSGGNSGLEPETADAWTAGLDYMPEGVRGLQLATTFFDIKYTNRISQIANPFAALTDPLNAFFVTRSPSLSASQSLYNSYPANEIFNNTGLPFNISNTAAILDYRLTNVARQTALGADMNVGYKLGTDTNGIFAFGNMAYLNLTQQDTPTSPSETLSGLSFYPAKFRARGGITWKFKSVALTGTINYLGDANNTQIVPIQSVASWTTVDASLRYIPNISGLFSGLRLSLSVVNLFDRDPPRVIVPTTVGGPSLDYDSSNTSPLGRFVSLTVSKEW